VCDFSDTQIFALQEVFPCMAVISMEKRHGQGGFKAEKEWVEQARWRPFVRVTPCLCLGSTRRKGLN